MHTTLIEMLAYRRPAGSKTERKFIDKYITPLGVQTDKLGNQIVRIGAAPILWSCHTDTVHRQGGFQAVGVTEGVAHVLDKGSNCLGADDTAGVYLMREMILAKRPGLYVFHRAEEIGGHGSNFIATRTPDLVKDITFAVALDRRGYRDVITHQAGGRCCSNGFADSLADALGDLKYAPCDEGIFTDTANYTDLIGECTNLSVGYHKEHTRSETLDLDHVAELREALLTVTCTRLELERKPGDCDDDWGQPYGSNFPYDDFDQEPIRKSATIYDLVKNYPDEVADALIDYGVSFGMLERDINMRRVNPVF